MARPHFSPGMFQPLDAEVKAIARAVAGWSRDRNGTWAAPGRTSGAWISSASTSTPRA